MLQSDECNCASRADPNSWPILSSAKDLSFYYLNYLTLLFPIITFYLENV